MDKQKIFDTAWDYYLTAKSAPGVTVSGADISCVYFSAHQPVRCAIGCQLPPDMAEKLQHRCATIGILLEDEDVGMDLMSYFDVKSDSDIVFLRALQSAHDNSAVETDEFGILQCVPLDDFRSQFEHQMRTLSDIHSLRTSEPASEGESLG